MNARVPFANRRAAGEALASRLASYAERPNVLILALPRGGVPVGYVVARALKAPLDVFLVRKLGVPGQEELAMGAIASGGVVVLNHSVMDSVHPTATAVDAVIQAERAELRRREQAYRGNRRACDVAGKVVILVDDGLATGASMRAAARAVRKSAPAWLVIAVPVAAEQTCVDLRAEADEVVCVVLPNPFVAVGMWYDDFAQITDDEVRDLLGAPETPDAML